MIVKTCNKTAKVNALFTKNSYVRPMVAVRSTILRFFGAFAAVLLALILTSVPAHAQTVSFQFAQDSFTGVYGDGTGRTVTVTLEPQDTQCAAMDASGRVTLYARSSVAACDTTIAIRFTSSDFVINQVNFADIDDMDGTGPRDSFGANVAGTWTSPTIEVHSFASPPAFANQVSRLTAAGAVGTFIANTAGENPVNESASFALTSGSSDFTIFFDDAQDGRDARNIFELGLFTVTPINPGGGGGPSQINCIEFDTGFAASGFTRTNTTFVGTSTQTSNSGTQSLFLRHGVATATSPVIGTTTITNTSVWVRRGADSFSENPDANEDLIIEGFTTAGTWVQLAQFNGSGTPGQIFNPNFSLPNNMRHTGFQIRFRTTGGSGSDFDYWHVDDVCVGSTGTPNVTVSKVSSIIADPVNGATNPKAIPGATVEYLITVTNSGDGAADVVSVVDNGPADAKFCLLARSGGPVIFNDPGGNTGLTYDYGGTGNVTNDLGVTADDLEFSNDGGTGFGYTPVDDGTGCDTNVTDFRVRPDGSFQPGSTFTIVVRYEIL